MKPFLIFFVATYSIAAGAVDVQTFAGSAHYTGGNLSCTGNGETVFVDAGAKTIIRNGVAFRFIRTDSFFGPIFVAYDESTGTSANWSLDVFSVSDASSLGEASLGNNEQSVQMHCASAP